MELFINIITKKQIYGLLLIIGLTILGYKAINILIEKIIVRGENDFDKKRKLTVVALLKNVIKYAIIVLALILILDLYGVNVSSLVASLGVASAVAALALQDTLKDFISGMSIIMDNYYIVGDFVTYNGFTGKVIELGLRSTKIEDFDGKVMTVANRNISEITNISQKTASALIIAPAAYEAPIEKVEKVLLKIVDEIKSWPTVKKETEYIGINELDVSSVNYGIRIYCSPGKVWQYKRDALRLIKKAFDKEKIEIPYTKIEVQNAKK